jgi:hypothetical protein
MKTVTNKFFRKKVAQQIRARVRERGASVYSGMEFKKKVLEILDEYINKL